MNTTEINNNYPILESMLNDAIKESVCKFKTKLGKTKLTETKIVEAMVQYLSIEIENIFRRVLKKKKTSVASIFCHQKPIVSYGSKPNPELGDILFLYINEFERNLFQYNSLLLQAKMSDKTELNVSPKEMHQLELYLNWPKFNYVRGESVDKVKITHDIDILPKTINTGAQYLLIDSNFDYCRNHSYRHFPMGCAIPAKHLILDNPLSVELLEFLKFKSGRAFEGFTISTKDDWTQMIRDLYYITLGTITGKQKSSRNVSTGDFNLLMSNIIGNYNSNNIINDEIDSNNEGGGISIILIKSSLEETNNFNN